MYGRQPLANIEHSKIAIFDWQDEKALGLVLKFLEVSRDHRSSCRIGWCAN
jgi:hypothetical protein